MIKKCFFALVFMFSGLFISGATFAHCDTMSGPVVKAAQKALTNNNVNYVLIWIHKPFEKKIKQAFEKALSDRKKDQKIADKEFFEGS